MINLGKSYGLQVGANKQLCDTCSGKWADGVTAKLWLQDWDGLGAVHWQAATAVGQFQTLTQALCNAGMLRRAQLIKFSGVLDSEMTEIILKLQEEKVLQ